MNNVRITVFATAALVVASSAFAQVAGPGTGVGTTHKQHVSTKDPTKQALHQALEEITMGKKILEKALPIYEGHRVGAIEFAKNAHEEIQKGLINQQQVAKATANEQVGTSKELGEAKKYPANQVSMSNQDLVLGGQHFENAIAILSKISGDYQNHKATAMNLLNQSLTELKIALQPYGGPQANMPKKGTNLNPGHHNNVIRP